MARLARLRAREFDRLFERLADEALIGNALRPGFSFDRGQQRLGKSHADPFGLWFKLEMDGGELREIETGQILFEERLGFSVRLQSGNSPLHRIGPPAYACNAR